MQSLYQREIRFVFTGILVYGIGMISQEKQDRQFADSMT